MKRSFSDLYTTPSKLRTPSQKVSVYTSSPAIRLSPNSLRMMSSPFPPTRSSFPQYTPTRISNTLSYPSYQNRLQSTRPSHQNSSGSCVLRQLDFNSVHQTDHGKKQ
eukprot:TRINITY_DN2446_c0_g1_i5.p1 TRINITY_DN2446_c0_g1~~TRINITY_DN2446_c0_g1_i5.p1  ORF type:complete len:107 (+),score=10.37 TRINITY_DN2446_c0_g1_i5:297-617(+)